MKIPYTDENFECSMIIKGKHPEVSFIFCREYCMYYNGNSKKPEQGFTCSYEEENKKGENMVILGDKVKDIVSGFKGIAVTRHSYLNGCDRITVQPSINKNGKHPDSCTFDEPQLKVITKTIFKIGSKLTGGTDKYMDEGR